MNLAPNGQPSNLSPEQYKLVRTPEFKAWFGDWENDPENASKVVDKNGEPLVVYHGTTSAFNVFNKRAFAEGIYFTSDKDYATQIYGKNYLSVFLKIKNIKDLGWSISTILPSQKNALLKKGIDGVSWIDADYKNNYREVAVWESDQIKLADGTNTTFDANNPDIRYEIGGNINNFNYTIGGL
jgi:hypothetical protein